MLAFTPRHQYTRMMRNYLDIPVTLIVTLILTVVLLWPLDQPPPGPEWVDKIAHFIAFAALALPLACTGRFSLLPIFILSISFGGVIELLQPNFSRDADVNDWIADIAGVLTGIFFGLVYRRHRMR
jgi:VanZ family protein